MLLWEKTKLKYFLRNNVEGSLQLSPEVFETFLSSPEDVAPEFIDPPNRRTGRGKDHPRYGRWVYAFAKVIKPEIVVEVGSYAGGTAVGWAKALAENGRGTLYCIDNDSYAEGTYPGLTTQNIENVGLPKEQYRLFNGNSDKCVRDLSKTLKGKVDIFLVDGDHRYDEALTDIQNTLPLMRPGGYILVHDVDRKRKMHEATADHPEPVYEAFMNAISDNGFGNWCILKYIRKHLGVIAAP